MSRAWHPPGTRTRNPKSRVDIGDQDEFANLALNNIINNVVE
ncbi:4303_t:CDS:2, partial [Gigaspora rosea]